MALLQAANSISCTHKLSLPVQRPAHSRICSSLSTPTLKGVPPPSLRFGSSFFNGSSLLKVKREIQELKSGSNSSKGGACTATSSITLSGESLRWIFAGAAAVLMYLKNTSINKNILVPLLALQAPRDVVTAVRGEYGLWAAFLALLVRLFYQLPGELELPLVLVLLLITAPLQVLDIRRTTAALVVSACVAAYLVYQHVNGAGGVKESFKGGALLASLAVIILVVVPVVIFFGGY
ncbi:hypothetical protein GOP47_0008442 [Adiantum capillus-veneris]|uniref:Uncharacterized protein n=1 Tax=Adiantum capillus-veneris TaxID=13818 RepID=A0A9D4UZT0_ADICA|nr:hypothetical protein GOP47_0008442 [Adiantum capillus-veneris]